MDASEDVHGCWVVTLGETDFTANSHRRNVLRSRDVRVEYVWLERRLHELERVTRDSVCNSFFEGDFDFRDRGVRVVEDFTVHQVDGVFVDEHGPLVWQFTLEWSGVVVWLERRSNILPRVGRGLVPLSVGVFDEVRDRRERSSLSASQKTSVGINGGLLQWEVVGSRELRHASDLDSRASQVTWR